MYTYIYTASTGTFIAYNEETKNKADSVRYNLPSYEWLLTRLAQKNTEKKSIETIDSNNSINPPFLKSPQLSTSGLFLNLPFNS